MLNHIIQFLILTLTQYLCVNSGTIIQNNKPFICEIPKHVYKQNMQLCNELAIPNVIIPFGNETIIARPLLARNKNTYNLTCTCPTSNLINSLLLKNFKNPYGIKNKLSDLEMKINLLKYNICCCKDLFFHHVVMKERRHFTKTIFYKLFNIRYSIPFLSEAHICM